MDMSTALHNVFEVKPKGQPRFGSGETCPLLHSYQDHPLMQLDRLAQLASLLEKTRDCRFVGQNLTDTSAFDHHARDPQGRTVEQVFGELAKPGSWVALFDVQKDPVYEAFLAEMMQAVSKRISPQEEVMDVRGFIFISAPPSVTPFHIDRGNNLWLQIRGQKTIRLWDRNDREVVAGQDVEKFIAYKALETIRLKDEHRARGVEYRCGPGDGVYFPSTTPHMVHAEPDGTPENSVSVSIGVNFYTKKTRRAAYVHAANALLRRLHVNPASPTDEEDGDRLKYALGRALIAAKKRLRGYTPPPGF